MKRIIMCFIISSLFLSCENRKKKGILPTAKLEDLMILYFFTDGASIMNNCDTRFNYTVGKVNEPVSGAGGSSANRYFALKEGNYFYVKNPNSLSSCITFTGFRFCDFLNNEVLSSNVNSKICKNLNENSLKLLPGEEKLCYLNGDLLNQFSNSVIVSVSGYNDSSTSSEKCSFYGEMK